MRRFLLFLLSLLSTVSAARASVTPTEGQLTLNCEWIFLKPVLDVPHYAVTTNVADAPNAQRGQAIKNDATFKPGYRMMGHYCLPDSTNSVSFRGAFLDTFFYDTVYGERVLSQVESVSTGVYDVGQANTSIKHFSLDALLGQQFVSTPRLYIEGKVGVQYSAVLSRENFFFVNTNVPGRKEVKYHSRLWGIGPEIEFNMDYELYRGISLCSKASGGLLVGKTHYNGKVRCTNTDKNYCYGDKERVILDVAMEMQPVYRVIPEWALRLGMNYSRCIAFMNINLECGYEGIGYIKALPQDYNVFSSFINITQTNISYNNICFHGPYIALAISY